MKVYEEENIARILHFSYDQFYALYVKFIGLDLDRDGLLGKGHPALVNYF